MKKYINHSLQPEKEITHDNETLLGFMLAKRGKAVDLDPAFKVNLHEELLSKVQSSHQSKFGFLTAGFMKFAAATLSLIIILLGIFYSSNKLNQKSIVSVAYAKEELKKQVDKMIQNNTIFYQKIKFTNASSKWDSKTGLVTESWIDQGSPRYKILNTFPDSTDYFVNDGSIAWNYNNKTKLLTKDIFVYRHPEDKNYKGNIDRDIVKEFNDLINSSGVTIKEETLNGKNVIVLDKESVGGSISNLTYDEYIFDKETFNPIQIKRFENVNGTKQTVQTEDFLAFENLPRTDSLVNQLFKFNITLPKDVTIIEQKVEAVSKTSITGNEENILPDVNPSKIVIGNNKAITANVTVIGKLDNNQVAEMKLGIYDRQNEFVAKYDLSEIGSSGGNDGLPVSAGGALPEGIGTGIYYVQIIFQNGHQYISKDTVEIVNNLY